MGWGLSAPGGQGTARQGFVFSGRGRDGRGMLSGSGAVRPGVRAPGPPSLLGGLGVVGGLVVNCIVDASIDIVFVLRFVVVVVRLCVLCVVGSLVLSVR